MRIVSVVGARPQFIKAAPVSLAVRPMHQEILVHTGQHHDAGMSDIFFDELGLPRPDHHLGISGGSHGAMVGRMLEALDRVITAEAPDLVLVYGDTNSTLAGALAASQLSVRLAHVEAGLRSFNRGMPEEINRVVTDHVSNLLFCPSENAVRQLAAEGITDGVFMVGDVMGDALRDAVQRGRQRSTILERLDLEAGRFVLATIHRAENTDDPSRLGAIVQALGDLEETVVLPLHPRTRLAVEQLGVRFGGRVRLLDPLGYLDMVRLEANARVIVTDSGGVQKEAYWLGVPCITVRDETEWVETVHAGWNGLVAANREAIAAAVRGATRPAEHPPLYHSEGAAARIAALLTS